MSDVAASAPAGAAQAAEQAASSAATSSAHAPTVNWLKRLETGEVTRAEAIEGLVAQAVERHGGVRLPAAMRLELEGVLRAALLDDPVLSRLLGEP